MKHTFRPQKVMYDTVITVLKINDDLHEDCKLLSHKLESVLSKEIKKSR